MDLCAPEVLTTARSGSGLHNSANSTPKDTSSLFPRQAWEANQTYSEYPRHKCLHELLTETAEAKRDCVAVQFEGKSLTFAELNTRSNQLARVLQRKGVGPESLVGLCVERSLEMVVSLLAILKAGGAYVPLDPAYPADRIKYVLDDARVQVLITQESLRTSLPETTAETICVDSDWRAF